MNNEYRTRKYKEIEEVRETMGGARENAKTFRESLKINRGI